MSIITAIALLAWIIILISEHFESLMMERQAEEDMRYIESLPESGWDMYAED